MQQKATVGFVSGLSLRPSSPLDGLLCNFFCKKIFKSSTHVKDAILGSTLSKINPAHILNPCFLHPL
jgi:hypothetical protein